ncbi:MAG: ABC transporter permease [Propionibacteriaceae bacterium]|nr:ABC transporter permease [Propionibacteriaceae bacterium]
MTATHAANPLHMENQAPRPRMPGLIAACMARCKAEMKGFFRDWSNLLFNMALPVMMMMVFAAVFRGKIPGSDIDYRLLFISGMVAVGVMSTTFQSLAISITSDREEGIIRRLASSPMPRSAYFVGLIVKALVTTILEVIVLIALGVLVYKLPMPADPERWFALLWVSLLGVSSCSLLGIAYTALIPSARAAPGAATPPFMVLQIISGVFFPLMMIPAVLRYVAYAFPLLWMAKGLRFVFLPDEMKVNEPGGSWDLGTVALVLIAWTVVGGVLSALTFRWRGQRVK